MKRAIVLALISIGLAVVAAGATLWYRAVQPTVASDTASVASATAPSSSGTVQQLPEPVAARVSFAIAGDVMLARNVRRTFASDAYRDLLAHWDLRPFEGVDVAIANLEGVLSDRAVPPEVNPHTFVFHFPPEALGVLQQLGLGGVSLANNHSLNAGAKGLATTRRVLEAAQIVPIGDPQTVTQAHVAQFEGSGLTLVVIGVNTVGNIHAPDPIPLIVQYKKNPQSRVIVFPHWGVEYAPKHSVGQQQLARAWIDAGADAVIGAHPHVVQDMEVYRDKPIFYSLGNFIFDQMFSAETQRGLIVKGEFVDDRLSLMIFPHESRRMQPQLALGAPWFLEWEKETRRMIDRSQDTFTIEFAR